MPVFDFSAAPADKKETKSQCTYTTFRSNETKATPEKPMLIKLGASAKSDLTDFVNSISFLCILS